MRRGRPALSALLTVLALAVALGATAQTSAYQIGPKDLLRVSVFEVPELNSELRVSDRGTIDLPPLGEVRVQGLSPLQLEEELKRRLEERFFQKATVSIQVAEYRSRPISIIGAIKQPGDLPFSGRWTLLEAITAAGGLADNHGALIHVLRRAENGLSDQIEISIQDLMVQADPRVNIPIVAGDLINVPATIEVTVYCLGAVDKPGALIFKSTERITILSAIARAGGLTDRASTKILIKRTDSLTGVEREVTVDYKRIVAGREADFKLAEGDVVVVKESFF